MRMNEIREITTNLTQNEDGLWVALDQRDVSYPEEGNELYCEVEDSSFWFNHRNNVITSLVSTFSPDGAVFDIGGGNGYVAMALQRSGIDCVVVEPGPSGARNAKQRGLNVVIQSTLEDAEFKSESIAAFGLFDVLEHIENDSEFLQTLHGHLVPKGYLYLTVPAYNILWSVDDDHAGHYRRYTTGTLTKKLESAGFTLRYCSYFFWFLAPAVFLLRSIPSRLRIRHSISKVTTKREHSTRKGIVGSVLDLCLALELKRIEERKKMPAGSSCIAVAQKVT